ncbi:hypothetical protein ILUMI_09665 [Ignelater luminosus]|uniref:CLIP domain-containing serine protease n=1 Tax=Ignelater luminosus TaxID=2038154 RepID=A0A8K0D3G1_IGNLU|nr:hypothetical protein ILUMI_09665 [Ignelater luminosus]
MWAKWRAVSSEWFIDDGGCRARDKGVGRCLPLRQCDRIVRYVDSAVAPTLVAKKIVKSYICGVTGGSIKVCCPYSNKIVVATPLTLVPVPTKVENHQKESVCCTDSKFVIPSSNNPNNEPSPDVTNHRNVGLLPMECGSGSSDRILFGNKTSLFEYSWMALLNSRLGQSDPDWENLIQIFDVVEPIDVRIGEHTINTDPDCEGSFKDRYCADPVQDLEIAKVTPRLKFDSKTFANDIGLIRLANRINITVDSVNPICLATTEALRNTNFENAKLTVTGWGITETDRRSLDLLQANVPVVCEGQCRKAYQKRQPTVTRRHICAGGINGGDSCKGDSGGPLKEIVAHNAKARFVQYGVVSFGP